MQSDKYIEDLKFKCENHPQNSYRAICYEENCYYHKQKRFLCVECLIQSNYAGCKEKIVSLQKFFQDPISELDKKSKNFQFLYNPTNMITFIDNIMMQINQVHQKFIDQLRKLKDEFIAISKQSREQVLQKIKVKEFQQQLTQVWNMDSYQGTQQFKSLENQLNDLIVNWRNLQQEYIKETTTYQKNDQIIQDLTMKLIDYKQKLKQEWQQIFYNQYLPIPYLDVLWRDQGEIKKFIHNIISNGKEIKYQLLFQGTRGNLRTDYYWHVCNQKSHLLTIITLKNGNILGGYSPCQLILKDDPYWVSDNTYQSFIFQYSKYSNKEEIYKQKRSTNIVLCNKNEGPAFGSDLKVSRDFWSIDSKLGTDYDITGYNVQSVYTHLIGDKNTEIEECRVFQIKFL